MEKNKKLCVYCLNFLYRYGHFALSVALSKNGEVVAVGAVGAVGVDNGNEDPWSFDDDHYSGYFIRVHSNM